MWPVPPSHIGRVTESCLSCHQPYRAARPSRHSFGGMADCVSCHSKEGRLHCREPRRPRYPRLHRLPHRVASADQDRALGNGRRRLYLLPRRRQGCSASREPPAQGPLTCQICHTETTPVPRIGHSLEGSATAYPATALEARRAAGQPSESRRPDLYRLSYRDLLAAKVPHSLELNQACTSCHNGQQVGHCPPATTVGRPRPAPSATARLPDVIRGSTARNGLGIRRAAGGIRLCPLEAPRELGMAELTASDERRGWPLGPLTCRATRPPIAVSWLSSRLCASPGSLDDVDSGREGILQLVDVRDDDDLRSPRRRR